MITLVQAGRRDEALGTFDEFQRITLATRGAEPSGQLAGLRRQIETHQSILPFAGAGFAPTGYTTALAPPGSGSPAGPLSSSPQDSLPQYSPYGPVPDVPAQYGGTQYGLVPPAALPIARQTNWKLVALKLVGAAVPLVSLGLASPVLFGVLAIKRRSLALFGSAIGYAGAIYVAMEWLGDVSGGLLLLAGMVAGSIQAALVIGRR
jgi:hypothetical protein